MEAARFPSTGGGGPWKLRVFREPEAAVHGNHAVFREPEAAVRESRASVVDRGLRTPARALVLVRRRFGPHSGAGAAAFLRLRLATVMPSGAAKSAV